MSEFLIEPRYRAKFISFMKKESAAERENNWRNKYIGMEGNVTFLLYTHRFDFWDWVEDDEEEGLHHRFTSSPIIEIKEDLPQLVIGTRNTTYVFEVINKEPDEDTLEYFKAICLTEEEAMKRSERFKRRKWGWTPGSKI